MSRNYSGKYHAKLTQRVPVHDYILEYEQCGAECTNYGERCSKVGSAAAPA